eukprot:TRINITY_DN4071_c0_g1_i1.p1 TRINITY_DN4071_c0_g1~~TRINITY_DN4071_c0_g1_i1.p1  ORF type:complete len:1612 (+),score=292.34 TRINITY_DN4071_c0_g1_i1:162-4838(+)
MLRSCQLHESFKGRATVLPIVSTVCICTAVQFAAQVITYSTRNEQRQLGTKVPVWRTATFASSAASTWVGFGVMMGSLGLWWGPAGAVSYVASTVGSTTAALGRGGLTSSFWVATTVRLMHGVAVMACVAAISAVGIHDSLPQAFAAIILLNICALVAAHSTSVLTDSLGRMIIVVVKVLVIDVSSLALCLRMAVDYDYGGTTETLLIFSGVMSALQLVACLHSVEELRNHVGKHEQMTENIRVTEAVARALQAFDLEEAAEMVDESNCPEGIKEAFWGLITNLASYRPFLPQSALQVGQASPASLIPLSGLEPGELTPQAILPRPHRDSHPISPRSDEKRRSLSDDRRRSVAVESTILTPRGRAKGYHDVTHTAVSIVHVNVVNFHSMVAFNVPTQKLVSFHSSYVDHVLTAARHFKGVSDALAGDRCNVHFNACRICPGHRNLAGHFAVRVTGPRSPPTNESCSTRDSELSGVARLHAFCPPQHLRPVADGRELLSNVDITAAAAAGQAVVGTLGSATMKGFQIIGTVTGWVVELEKLCSMLRIRAVADDGLAEECDFAALRLPVAVWHQKHHRLERKVLGVSVWQLDDPRQYPRRDEINNAVEFFLRGQWTQVLDRLRSLDSVPFDLLSRAEAASFNRDPPPPVLEFTVMRAPDSFGHSGSPTSSAGASEVAQPAADVGDLTETSAAYLCLVTVSSMDCLAGAFGAVGLAADACRGVIRRLGHDGAELSFEGPTAAEQAAQAVNLLCGTPPKPWSIGSAGGIGVAYDEEVRVGRAGRGLHSGSCIVSTVRQRANALAVLCAAEGMLAVAEEAVAKVASGHWRTLAPEARLPAPGDNQLTIGSPHEMVTDDQDADYAVALEHMSRQEWYPAREALQKVLDVSDDSWAQRLQASAAEAVSVSAEAVYVELTLAGGVLQVVQPAVLSPKTPARRQQSMYSSPASPLRVGRFRPDASESDGGSPMLPDALAASRRSVGQDLPTSRRSVGQDLPTSRRSVGQDMPTSRRSQVRLSTPEFSAGLMDGLGRRPHSRIIEPQSTTTELLLDTQEVLNEIGGVEDTAGGTVILAHGPIWTAADMLRLGAVVLQSCALPPLVVFSTPGTAAACALYVCDAITLADIVLHFRRPYAHAGLVVTQQSKIVANYLRTWCAVDVTSVLPCELLHLSGCCSGSYHWLRLNRCIAVIRVPELLQRILETTLPTAHPVLVNLATSSFMLLYILVVLGCIWGWLVKEFGNMAEYLRLEAAHHGPLDGGEQFMHSFHWAVRGFAGYGQPWPFHDSEYLASILCDMLGVGLFATLIAYMRTLLGVMDGTEKAHFEKIENVCSTMDYLRKFDRVTPQADHLIKQYYKILFRRTRQVEQGQFDFILEDLPGELSSEMAVSLRSELVVRTLGKLDISGQFHYALLSGLRHRFEAVDGELFKRGEQAQGIAFFLRGAGIAYIGPRAQPDWQEELGPGDWWGETSTLLGGPEPASVMFTDYTQLLLLPVDRSQRLARKYPMELEPLYRTATSRRRDISRTMLLRTALQFQVHLCNETRREYLWRWMLWAQRTRRSKDCVA